MAPSYKVSYFELRGVGEPIRFLLAYGGVDFEDYRVKIQNWMAVKPTMPFGKMPLLEVDGKKVHQSLAICRYLGKQFNLAGDNDWEAMEIDIIADTIQDMRQSINDCYTAEENPEVSAETEGKLKAVVMNETFPYFLPKLEEIVKKNNGYFANGKLSWIDLYWATIIDSTGDALAGDFHWNRPKETPTVDILKDYPNLKHLKDRVFALPAIKAWAAKQSHTPF